MSHSPAALSPIAPPLHERLASYTRRIPQRFGERDFWITQVGVFTVTGVHVLMELWSDRGTVNAPSAVSTFRWAESRAGGILGGPHLVASHRQDVDASSGGGYEVATAEPGGAPAARNRLVRRRQSRDQKSVLRGGRQLNSLRRTDATARRQVSVLGHADQR